MMDFLKKAMDWALEKEAEAAKGCHARPEDIDKQIKMIEEKREALKKKYEEEDAEFAHILSKLHLIKAESLQCHTK
jgi:hypothetical protein